MKVIKWGIKPNKKIYRSICRICNTEFEYEQGEAEYVSDQRDGDFLSIKCPLCKYTMAEGVK